MNHSYILSAAWPWMIAAAALALIYLTVFVGKPESPTKSLVKTLSVLILAVASWWMHAPALIVIALALCAAGDYLLSRDGPQFFLGGIVAFGAGHMAYSGLFLTHRLARPDILFQPSRRDIIACLVVFGMVMAALLFRRAGPLRFAVVGYVGVIVFMAVMATVLPGLDALMYVPIAVMLFVLSDSLLAVETFLIDRNGTLARGLPYLVWPTYWLAQLCFFIAFAGGFMK